MSLTDALLLEPYRDPHEVWISVRKDGVRGSGTINDPFNGGTLPTTPVLIIIETAVSRLQGYWARPTAISMAVDPKFAAEIPYTFRRALVRSNLIRQADWRADAEHLGMTIANAENVLVDRNILDVGFSFPLRFKQTVAPAFFNNRTPSGKLIRGYDYGDNVKQYHSEVETLIEDAFALCL